MDIVIYGTGSEVCSTLEKEVIRALAEVDVIASLEVVMESKQIREAGIYKTPAIVINGIRKALGRIPSKDEIVDFIKEEQ